MAGFKENKNTGENLSKINVTAWADGTELTAENEAQYLGGLYNKDTDTGEYFRWASTGAFPISRLTTVNRDNVQKLVDDLQEFGRGSISLDIDLDLDGGVLNLSRKVKIIGEFGVISNGEINGNRTVIEGGRLQIFGDDLIFSGSYKHSSVYPEWFGATGDGSTDDTTSIQSALDFAKGRIEFETNATYVVSSVNVSNPGQIIDLNECIIQQKEGILAYTFNIVADNVTIEDGSSRGNYIEGMTGNQYNSASVNVSDCDNVTVRKVRCENNFGIAIRLKNTNSCLVENNTIVEPRIQGIFAESSTGIENNGLRILNNKIYVANGAISNGIYVGSDYSTNAWSSDYTVSQNYIIGSPEAVAASRNMLITARGKRGNITGNTCMYGRMGITNDYNEGGIITNNVCIGFRQCGIETVGREEGNSDGINVSKNYLRSANESGIYGIWCSGDNINRIIFEGNTIYECNIGINISAAIKMSNVKILGSQIIDCGRNINIKNVENITISKNSLYLNNSSRDHIYFDSCKQITAEGNDFEGVYQGSLVFYFLDAIEVDNVTISENYFQQATNNIRLGGGALYGNSFKILNNTGQFENINYIDRKNNISERRDTSFSTPEGNVSAGISSTFYNKNNGGFWYKSSGTSNTGWKKVENEEGSSVKAITAQNNAIDFVKSTGLADGLTNPVPTGESILDFTYTGYSRFYSDAVDLPKDNINGFAYQVYNNSNNKSVMVITSEGETYTNVRTGTTWVGWKIIGSSTKRQPKTITSANLTAGDYFIQPGDENKYLLFSVAVTNVIFDNNSGVSEGAEYTGKFSASEGTIASGNDGTNDYFTLEFPATLSATYAQKGIFGVKVEPNNVLALAGHQKPS